MADSERTPYSRVMKQERAKARKRERNKKNPRVTKDGGMICGGKRSSGAGACQLPAGFRTDHVGIGRCYHHGGNVPNVRLNVAKQEAVFMGAPKDINPVEAMTWCIHITAGEVEWYSERLAELETADWYEQSVIGKQMHVLARERANAVTRLARFSKDAIALGIAERAVRIAETYGAVLARLLKGVIDDLELNAEQKERAPSVIRKHLILMERSKPEQPELSAPTNGDAA